MSVRVVISLSLCGWFAASFAQSHSAANPGEQATFYEENLKLRPDWAEGWFNYGGSLYQLQKYNAAKSAFARAALLAPDNGAVLAFLGLSEHQLGDDAAALSDIRKGEDLGLPNNAAFVSEVYNSGAAICLRSKDFTSAVAQLQPLVKLGFKSPEAIQELGLATLALNLPPSAIPPSQQTIIQMAGEAAWALYSNHVADSAKLCNQLIASFPHQPGVHYLNGIRLITVDHSAARQEFLQELQIDPKRVDARVQIAILDLKLGKPDEAAKYAREALQSDRTNILAEVALGKALLDLGQVSEAAVQFQAAEKLAPGKPEIHAYLAKTYQRAGNLQASHQEQAEFFRLKAKERTAESVSLDPAP